MTTTADGCKLIGGGHFVGHLDYRTSEKNIFELEPEFDRSNSYMNLEEIRLKMTKLE